MVGVVGDVKHAGLEAESQAEMYLPFRLRPAHGTTLVLRSAGDPLRLAPLVRQHVGAIDPDQPLGAMHTLEGLLTRSMASRRLPTVVGAIFAGTALLLAAMGLYGVLSYSVARRTGEIGLRAALGARPRDVTWLIVGHGLALSAAGLLCGLGAAWALMRLLSSLLFGVTPTDALTYAAAAAFLMLVAGLASYVPARRAAALDPLQALREG